MNLWRGLKVKVREGEPLKKHTTFRIGGGAQYFAVPCDIQALKLLLKRAKRAKIRILVLGAGSNILAQDAGIKGLVLHLDSPAFRKITLKNNRIIAGSGVSISRLLLFCRRRGLSGTEFLSGIPGTIGGALAMNAGAWGGSIGDTVTEVKVTDYSGRIKTLKRQAVKFGYRTSDLARYVILSAAFKVRPGSRAEVERKIKEYLLRRRATQDLSRPSAGCVFKNPKNISAGLLIDACRLKGMKRGGARISQKHANFILNTGNASFADVQFLMRRIKEKVRREHGITLVPEIKVWA